MAKDLKIQRKQENWREKKQRNSFNLFLLSNKWRKVIIFNSIKRLKIDKIKLYFFLNYFLSTNK